MNKFSVKQNQLFATEKIKEECIEMNSWLVKLQGLPYDVSLNEAEQEIVYRIHSAILEIEQAAGDFITLRTSEERNE